MSPFYCENCHKNRATFSVTCYYGGVHHFCGDDGCVLRAKEIQNVNTPLAR